MLYVSPLHTVELSSKFESVLSNPLTTLTESVVMFSNLHRHLEEVHRLFPRNRFRLKEPLTLLGHF